MKTYFPHHLVAAMGLALLGLSCNNTAKSDAEKTMQNIQSVVKSGMNATTKDGYMMKAKINGKEWIADAMHPPYSAGKIAGKSSSGNPGIALNFYSRGKNYQVGYTEKISKSNAADLFLDDNVVFYGGYNGEIRITKMDGQWVEGTFYFTASSDNPPASPIEVTDGFFRIPASE